MRWQLYLGVVAIGIVSSPISANNEGRFVQAKPLKDFYWLRPSDLRLFPEFEKLPHGMVRIILYVSPKGRVTRCTNHDSSGDPAIDGLICNLISKRARFLPAKAPDGHAVEDTHVRQVVW